MAKKRKDFSGYRVQIQRALDKAEAELNAIEPGQPGLRTEVRGIGAVLAAVTSAVIAIMDELER